MFGAYTEFQNLSGNDNCFLGFGSEAQKKCGQNTLQEAETFCTANPTALCCTAQSNLIVSGTVTSVALSTPTNAVPPGSLTATSEITESTSISTASSAGNNAASNGSSGSSGINPLFIGAGAIGVALIIILASALFFMNSQKKAKSLVSPTLGAPVEKLDPVMVADETMEVVFEYQANLFDELSLRIHRVT
jgi:hypothetical protein